MDTNKAYSNYYRYLAEVTMIADRITNRYIAKLTELHWMCREELSLDSLKPKMLDNPEIKRQVYLKAEISSMLRNIAGCLDESGGVLLRNPVEEALRGKDKISASTCIVLTIACGVINYWIREEVYALNVQPLYDDIHVIFKTEEYYRAKLEKNYELRDTRDTRDTKDFS